MGAMGKNRAADILRAVRGERMQGNGRVEVHGVEASGADARGIPDSRSCQSCMFIECSGRAEGQPCDRWIYEQEAE